MYIELFNNLKIYYLIRLNIKMFLWSSSPYENTFCPCKYMTFSYSCCFFFLFFLVHFLFYFSPYKI